MTEPTEEIKDFSIDAKPKRFRVDDDLFIAPRTISATTLEQLSGLYARMGGPEGGTALDLSQPGAVQNAMGVIAEMFAMLLPGEQGVRFKARLLADGSDPEMPTIDILQQAVPIMNWLMEQYGMRPTLQSSGSPDGLETGALTDGAPAAGSTGEAYPALTSF